MIERFHLKFIADWNNGNVTLAEMVESYGASPYKLRQRAKRLRLLTKATTNHNRYAAGYVAKERQPRRYGSGGCNNRCRGWRWCNDHPHEPVLCEVALFLDENPALLDGEQVYRKTIPIVLSQSIFE